MTNSRAGTARVNRSQKVPGVAVWRYRVRADGGPLFETMKSEDMIGRPLSMEALVDGGMRHFLAQDGVGLPRAWNGGTHAHHQVLFVNCQSR